MKTVSPFVAVCALLHFEGVGVALAQSSGLELSLSCVGEVEFDDGDGKKTGKQFSVAVSEGRAIKGMSTPRLFNIQTEFRSFSVTNVKVAESTKVKDVSDNNTWMRS